MYNDYTYEHKIKLTNKTCTLSIDSEYQYIITIYIINKNVLHIYIIK